MNYPYHETNPEDKDIKNYTRNFVNRLIKLFNTKDKQRLSTIVSSEMAYINSYPFSKKFLRKHTVK